MSVIEPKAPAAGSLASQRKAVAALRERMRVQIDSQRFADGRLLSTRVVVEGEFYDVDERQLAELRRGVTPDRLYLDPADPRED